MITAVHHIALIISKEEHLSFYRNLGFTEVFRKERSYDVVVLMDGYGMQLEIFIDGNHERRGDQEPLGLRHFALKVDGKLEDEIDRLRNANQAVLDCQIMSDWRGERFVFLKDPDGTVVELHE